MSYARLEGGPDDAIEAALTGRAAGIAVSTSGSTGWPRMVQIGTNALVESARLGLEILGGPGAWLQALPATRIGGALVLLRSKIAEIPATPLPLGAFTAAGFAAATASLPRHERRYTSLVPTQLARVLATDEGREALASYDAVLVGGGALFASQVPANVVRSYGLTETTAGCAYDGAPLPGIAFRVDDAGRISVAGPTLADGYEDGDNAVFGVTEGRRWFRTSDVGTWDGARLTVLGRADDVINTGGHKVHPLRVERELTSLASIADAVVVGVPDPEWGERIVAMIAPAPGSTPPALGEVREVLRERLEGYELPQSLLVVDSLPRLETGKIDRGRVRALASG